MIYFLKQQFKHRPWTARSVVPCFTIRYTIADMAIWPWIGWLVDGKIYGEAGEFLQVKDGYVEDEGKERLLFTWPFFCLFCRVSIQPFLELSTNPLFISDSEPVLTLLATLTKSVAVPGTSWTLWQSQENCNSRSTRTFAHGLHVLEHVPQCFLVKTRQFSYWLLSVRKGAF